MPSIPFSHVLLLFDLRYFHNLPRDKKKSYIEHIHEIRDISETNVPMRFRILNSNMDLRTNSIALHNLEKLDEIDVSTGE